MSEVKKMFLLSPQQLRMLTQRATPHTTTIGESALGELETQMHGLLNQPGMNSHEKVKRYNQLLQRYLNLVRKEENQGREIILTERKEKTDEEKRDVPGEEEEEERQPGGATRDKSVQEVVQQVAPRARKNVGYIMQKLLDSDGAVRWTQSGELIIRDSPIKGSHILDLMKTLSQPKSQAVGYPKGWEPFLNVISELNIPLTTVGNIQARKALSHLKDYGAGNATARGPPPPSSPPPVKKKRKRRAKFSTDDSPLVGTPHTPRDSSPEYRLWPLKGTPYSPWIDYSD